MEEGVARDGVRGVRVAPPLEEAGGEGVVVGRDVFAVWVASVQLLQGQPEGRVPGCIAELQVKTVLNRVARRVIGGQNWS